MKRRDFLKLGAAAGMTLTASSWGIRGVRALEGPYQGPYWLFISAGGGWDPTCLFNPTDNPDYRRAYSAGAQLGNIPYAPIPKDPALLGIDPLNIDLPNYLLTNEEFLTLHGSRLLVINGIDTSTNNHDSGTKGMSSGKISGEYPALGALVAAAKAPDKPLAFVSGGGYDITANLVPLARINNPTALQRIAFPNAISPTNPTGASYHTPETMTRIMRAQADRIAALRAAQNLPTLQDSMDSLSDARQRDNELAQLMLPATLADFPLNGAEGMVRQGQLAMSAFRAGLAVSATIRMGGFDTHGNHDQAQNLGLQELLFGVDFLWNEAATFNVQHQLVIVVTSEFGRGPHYNAGNGKDHWPVTSMFAMGAGIQGGRAIGGTDFDQRAIPINPDTLELDDQGVVITPEIVHNSLRAKAGVGAIADGYPLVGPTLPLFG